MPANTIAFDGSIAAATLRLLQKNWLIYSRAARRVPLSLSSMDSHDTNASSAPRCLSWLARGMRYPYCRRIWERSDIQAISMSLAQQRFHISDGRLLEEGQMGIFLCEEASAHGKRTCGCQADCKEGVLQLSRLSGVYDNKTRHHDKDNMGPNGVSSSSLGPRPTQDEVLIGVMGATGTGKSTFINLVSGSALGVSSGLVSCTNDVGVVSFPLDGRKVTLLDTPGFDDTNKSDTNILKTIALYLSQSYEEGQKLAGIIYIHRITDVRMGGTSTRNFGMFRKLCGDSSLKNVVILTNMWGLVDRELGEARERELAADNTFFKGVLERGARMVRHDGSLGSAQSVLRYIMGNRPVTLQIQRELVDEKKDILQTAAGEEINKALIEQNKRHQEEMAEILQEHRDALESKDEETRLELEAAKKELEARMKRSEEEQREWASNFQQEKEEFQRKMQETQAQAARELKELEDRYRREIDEFRQQRQMDSEEAKKREAELSRQIREARNRGGGCLLM